MRPEEQYESWKKQRATVEVSDDFAQRVMTSIHERRRLTAYFLVRSLMAAAGRVGFVRAGVCLLALTVWVMRIGSILAIFVPR